MQLPVCGFLHWQNYLGKIARVALLCAFGLPLAAYAEDTVTITESTRMDFGTIAIPASGSQYLTLNPINSSISGTGDKLFGIANRGTYSLKSSGNTSTSITIDVMNVSTNSASVTLDNFTGIYDGGAIANFPSSPLSPAASGPLTDHVHDALAETSRAAHPPRGCWAERYRPRGHHPTLGDSR